MSYKTNLKHPERKEMLRLRRLNQRDTKGLSLNRTVFKIFAVEGDPNKRMIRGRNKYILSGEGANVAQPCDVVWA